MQQPTDNIPTPTAESDPTPTPTVEQPEPSDEDIINPDEQESPAGEEIPKDDPVDTNPFEYINTFHRLMFEKRMPNELIDYLESILDKVPAEDARQMVSQLEDYIAQEASPKLGEMLNEAFDYEYIDDYMLDEFNNRPEDIEDPDLRAIMQMIRAGGMLVNDAEGALYVDVDYDFIHQKFASVFTDDVRAYYQLQDLAVDKPFAEDAGLLISWDELAERIYGYEKFMKNYPDSEYLSSAGETWGIYVNAYLLGLENTPVYDYDNYKLDGEVFKSYQRTIEKYAGSKLRL